MNLTNARSPFIVTVPFSANVNNTEGYVSFTGAYGSQSVGAGSEVVFMKPNTGLMVWNMSNLIREFILLKWTGLSSVPTLSDNSEICYFRILRGYVQEGEVQEPISTVDYIGLDGYTSYGDFNVDESVDTYKLLTNTLNKSYWGAGVPPFFEVLTEEFNCDKVSIYYTQTLPTFLEVSRFLYPIKNQVTRIPYTLSAFNNNFTGAVSITVEFDLDNVQTGTFTFTSTPIEECKYVVYTLAYVNRLGGWDFFTFYKSSKQSISVTNTDFQVSPIFDINGEIDPYEPQFKTYNTNAKKKIKVNTNWIDESKNVEIEDLMLSERMLLREGNGSFTPVNIVTSSMDFKKTVNEKMINYELEFEYAYNVINDVV